MSNTMTKIDLSQFQFRLISKQNILYCYCLCYEFIVFIFFPLRECIFFFIIYIYFFYTMSINGNGLSICIDKCEHTLKIQNVNFDCLDELLLNNNTCMSKIINPIRTIMSSMSLRHQYYPLQ